MDLRRHQEGHHIGEMAIHPTLYQPGQEAELQYSAAPSDSAEADRAREEGDAP